MSTAIMEHDERSRREQNERVYLAAIRRWFRSPAALRRGANRVDPSGGDSDVRPSGAELSGDAAFSPDANSLEHH